MSHMPPTITTRDGLREAIRFDLAEKLTAAEQRVALEDGDAWNNVPVITRKDLDEAIAAVFDEPLPPTSETVAEVSTPATIEVSAECPRCFIATTIEMTITPELRVNSDGSSIHLRGKAKAKTHVCGQLELPEVKRGETVDGQAPLFRSIEGEPEDVVEIEAPGLTVVPDPETCDWQGCSKHHGHRGRHTPGSSWEARDESGAGQECVGSNHVPGCNHFDKPPAEDPDGDLLPA